MLTNYTTPALNLYLMSRWLDSNQRQPLQHAEASNAPEVDLTPPHLVRAIHSYRDAGLPLRRTGFERQPAITNNLLSRMSKNSVCIFDNANVVKNFAFVKSFAKKIFGG